jgi:hypothetical protein
VPDHSQSVRRARRRDVVEAHMEEPDPIHPLCLLRLGRDGRAEETQNRRANKRASVHYSMTSSARNNSMRGIVSPRAFAVFALITSSSLVACSTGKSAGLAPRRIRST